MKNLTVTFVLVSLMFFVHAQKVIENPKVGLGTNSVIITKIELTNSETALTFNTNMEPGMRFGIAGKSFIQIVGESDSLFMIRKDAPEPVNGWITVPEGGLSYTLFFPPIDKKTEKIDFIEPISNPYNIYDIEINEELHHSVVPKELSGNWFSENNGEWTFSFLDSLTIIDNKAWEYATVKKNENGYAITLKNDTEIKKFQCKTKGTADCLMSAGGGPFKPYSKNSLLLKKYTDKKVFDQPVLNPGKVTYSGVIRGYNNRLKTSTGLIRYMHRLTNQQNSHIVKIDKFGRFSVEFELDFPQEISIRLPGTSATLFFEPGKNIFHLAHSGDEEFPSLFMGEGAAVNYALAKIGNIGRTGMSFYEKILGMTDSEYVDYILKEKDEDLDQLHKIQQEYPFSPKAYQLRKMDIEYGAATNAIRYQRNAHMAKYYANREIKKEEEFPMESEMFNPEILSKKLNIPTNFEIAMASGGFFSMLQALRYTNFEHPRNSYLYQMVELQDSIKKEGVEITGEEEDMFRFIRSNLLDNFTYTKSQDFNKSYREVLTQFRQKHADISQRISQRHLVSNNQKNIETVFGNEGRPLEDFYTLQSFLAGLHKSEIVDENGFKKAKESIETDFLKEFAIAAFYRKKAELEVKNTGVASKPKTEGDKLFESIVGKYRGKVVFVDFWATWCGPCLSGIEKIKPLKEELKNEDIVFVYITNPSSPEKDYAKKIPEIKGEHYRVNGDEWNYLTEKFNIYGIPHYSLVGKKGEIVNEHMMPLQNEQLKKVLMEQANEK